MKTYHYIIILLLGIVTMPTELSAQKRGYSGEIAVSATQLRQRGDSLYVNLTFDPSHLGMQSHQALMLTPTLTTPQGKECSLPTVEFKGRNNYHSYARTTRLMSASKRKAYQATAPKAVWQAYGKYGTEPRKYRVAVPFESWMGNAQLELRKKGCGCNGIPQELGSQPLMAQVVTEPMNPTMLVAYTKPDVEEIKQRHEIMDLSLNFAVGRVELNPSFGNNSSELQRVEELIAQLKADRTITLNAAQIVGYASPEGSEGQNRRLSEGRALALKSYLSEKFDMPSSFYQVSYGGENWNGLLAALNAEEYEIEHKAYILEIVRGETIEQDRKMQLIALYDGAPYRQLLTDIFPSLRIAQCRMEFVARAFDVNEAKVLMKTQPSRLSLEEMYRVANTYPTGSPEFLEVFDLAARLFPTDEVANLNAAAAALDRMDADAAEIYLNRIHSRVRVPAFDNNRGVLMVLRKEYKLAQAHFEAASAAGMKEATENLKRLPHPDVEELLE